MGVFKTCICFLLLPLLPGTLRIAAAAGPSFGGKKKQVDQIGDLFARIQYRPQSMARHITRSSAWKEGRRDILDWGCGGGGLAQTLARAGARRVVAVDLNVQAMNSTKQLLEPFDNAVARSPRRPMLFGSAGQIGYASSFDIVVSFCGALSQQTTLVPRIATVTAFKQALRACREGGTVIVGEVVDGLAAHYFQLIALLLAAVFGWKCKAPWLWGRPEPVQYALWFLMGRPFYGLSGAFKVDSFVFTITLKNISRSFQLREWRISSILWGIWFLMRFIKTISAGINFVKEHEKTLSDAGLVDVKHCSYLVPFPSEPVHGKLASPVARTNSKTVNLMMFPRSRLFIFEGVKRGSK